MALQERLKETESRPKSRGLEKWRKSLPTSMALTINIGF